MKIEIWSDVVCPWCYIGKAHLDQALSVFAHADQAEVVWRSFELDPGAPAQPSTDRGYVDRLAHEYGRTRDQAQAMLDSMTAAGAAEGLDLRFDRVRAGNSFDAHRLIHLAGGRGLATEMKTRLFAAYFTEGEVIADHAALARLGAEVGLDAAEVETMLRGDDCANAVRADEQQATDYGISAVPFFVVERIAVQGAQPAEVLRQVLDRAWDKRAAATA